MGMGRLTPTGGSSTGISFFIFGTLFLLGTFANRFILKLVRSLFLFFIALRVFSVCPIEARVALGWMFPLTDGFSVCDVCVRVCVRVCACVCVYVCR